MRRVLRRTQNCSKMSLEKLIGHIIVRLSAFYSANF